MAAAMKTSIYSVTLNILKRVCKTVYAEDAVRFNGKDLTGWKNELPSPIQNRLRLEFLIHNRPMDGRTGSRPLLDFYRSGSLDPNPAWLREV